MSQYRYWISDPQAPSGEESKIDERTFVVPRSKPVEGNWKRRPTMASGKKSNPWTTHVKKYMKTHKCSLKEAMVRAKATYKK